MTIPEEYACSDDSVAWLPLRWSNSPRGTAELAMTIVVDEQVREAGGVTARSIGGWLISGLPADADSLDVGKPPEGSVVVRYPRGFSCPERAGNVFFTFTLYAMPEGREIVPSSVSPAALESLPAEALASTKLPTKYGDLRAYLFGSGES